MPYQRGSLRNNDQICSPTLHPPSPLDFADSDLVCDDYHRLAGRLHRNALELAQTSARSLGVGNGQLPRDSQHDRSREFSLFLSYSLGVDQGTLGSNDYLNPVTAH